MAKSKTPRERDLERRALVVQWVGTRRVTLPMLTEFLGVTAGAASQFVRYMIAEGLLARDDKGYYTATGKAVDASINGTPPPGRIGPCLLAGTWTGVST